MPQLKCFLGLVNYYCKFLPNLSNTWGSPVQLLQKNIKWIWGTRREEGFPLTSDCVLIHFDLERKLILACDASPYGIGAVLSHRMDTRMDKPVAFSSCTLAPTEKKYSQIEKEGLAIIFGVKGFCQYLFGRQLTILLDHKPLQHYHVRVVIRLPKDYMRDTRESLVRKYWLEALYGGHRLTQI